MRNPTWCEHAELENAVLELADIIRENRMLRKENSDLRLRLAANDALIASFAGHDSGEYEFLSEIIRKNNSVDLCRGAGWETSEERVDNWEKELERYRKGKRQ